MFGRLGVRRKPFTYWAEVNARGAGMKKTLTIFLVSLVVLAGSALLVGCGGDTKQAKQYMKEGNAQVEKLKSDTSAFGDEMTALSSITDPTAAVAAVNKAKTTAANLSKTADQAAADFQKIKSLHRVPDYVKYADLEIKAMDLFQQLVKSIDSYFNQFLSMVNSGDLSGLQSASKASSDTINKLGQEYSRLDQQAQQLKSDKKL
ncbi:MAG TPA: hypothetical protein VIK22_06630 [Candidatus Anoxymicrobiaceae bacterium]